MLCTASKWSRHATSHLIMLLPRCTTSRACMPWLCAQARGLQLLRDWQAGEGEGAGGRGRLVDNVRRLQGLGAALLNSVRV